MKNIIINCLLIVSTILITSCANVDDAIPFAEEFYLNMQNKDYSEVMELMDKSLTEKQGIKDLQNFIYQKEALGELVSFTKENDDRVMESDGKSLVRLMYTVKYEKKTLYEYLVLVKRDDQYFVNNYGYYDTKEKRAEFTAYNESY